MAKEWIDVADTAVKIGLGALITGVFTFIGVRFSHKSDKEKYLLEHTTKVIEQITEEIGIYFNAWNYYISKISGITKVLDSNEISISERQNKAIKEKNDLLVDSWRQKNSAKSKSYLIKADKVADSIIDCTILEKEIRDIIVFQKKIPTYEEIIEHRKEVRKAQKAVYVQLSEYYAKLGT